MSEEKPPTSYFLADASGYSSRCFELETPKPLCRIKNPTIIFATDRLAMVAKPWMLNVMKRSRG